MTGFLILLAICGHLAGLFMTWAFLLLTGVLIVPFCAALLIWLGHSVPYALTHALIGFFVLQVGFVTSGWCLELWRGNRSMRAWRFIKKRVDK